MIMKGIIITHKGIEDISKKEIKELINSNAIVKDTICIFPIKKIEDLCTLCYSGQSFIKVLYYIDSLEVDKNFKENLKKKIKKNIKIFEKFIKKKQKFKVKCVKIDSDIITSEIEDIAGSVVNYKVDLEAPDLILYIYIYKTNCYIGLDFSGFDLSKREYKIFNFPFSLKGNIAYSLIRLSGYTKKEKILDPFCSSGEIIIEAALFASNMPSYYYKKNEFLFNKYLKFDFNKIDKDINIKNNIYALDSQFRNVRAAEKNAKIAGINKIINFSRTEIEWLDTKFKKNEIDMIVTNIRFSKYQNIEKLVKEFFHQCKYILSKKGLILIVTNNKELLENSEFKLKEQREIWQGKEKLEVLIYAM